ncbi:hypothetical protein KOAAANKH_02580 [Brevundimonas sp. NIBR10]|nr:hypothetical protein KOAAANKH_02580 [Brevundimonas sp. NIBR10]
MPRRFKLWLRVVAGVYVGIGFTVALLLSQAMPAINLAGAAYIAATWPAWVKGSPISLPVPVWAFTFKADQ